MDARDGKTQGCSFDLKFNAQFPSYLVIQSLEVIALPFWAITSRRGIPRMEQVFILIQFLLSRTYPPRDFSTSVSRAYLPYLLYFIRSMKLYPPRVFVNRFRSFFHDFLIFAAFAALFWRFCFSKQKVIHSRLFVDNPIFYFAGNTPRRFRIQKSAATAVAARKTQIPIVAKQPLCKRLVQRKHKKNLHFYRKHRFSRTKKDGKRFAIDFS